jgi:hypothetical protein
MKCIRRGDSWNSKFEYYIEAVTEESQLGRRREHDSGIQWNINEESVSIVNVRNPHQKRLLKVIGDASNLSSVVDARSQLSNRMMQCMCRARPVKPTLASLLLVIQKVSVEVVSDIDGM